MTVPERTLSDRPTLIVDQHGPPVRGRPGFPGFDAPFGRERVVKALRTNKVGPVLIEAAHVLCDDLGCTIADPDGTYIGRDALWIHRLLSAAKTLDTRRL